MFANNRDIVIKINSASLFTFLEFNCKYNLLFEISKFTILKHMGCGEIENKESKRTQKYKHSVIVEKPVIS